MALELKSNAHVITTWSTLVACGGVIWWAFGFAAQVDDNTESIRSAHIRSISQELRYLETEKSKMELYEQQNGITALSTQIKTNFDKDITKLERERSCLKDLSKSAKLCDEG